MRTFFVGAIFTFFFLQFPNAIIESNGLILSFLLAVGFALSFIQDVNEITKK